MFDSAAAPSVVAGTVLTGNSGCDEKLFIIIPDQYNDERPRRVVAHTGRHCSRIDSR